MTWIVALSRWTLMILPRPLPLLLFPAVLQMTGADPVVPDTEFWKTVFKSARSTAITSRVQYVVGVQWAVWLAHCQLKTIEEFQVHSCMYPALTC